MQAIYTDVVDADLSKYSDTIPHSELMQCVARRIVDRDMLRLIKMWLKVPVEERDENGKPRVSGGKRISVPFHRGVARDIRWARRSECRFGKMLLLEASQIVVDVGIAQTKKRFIPGKTTGSPDHNPPAAGPRCPMWSTFCRQPDARGRS